MHSASFKVSGLQSSNHLRRKGTLLYVWCITVFTILFNLEKTFFPLNIQIHKMVLYISVSQPPGYGLAPGTGINCTGPLSYKKRIYRAAVSQMLRTTALDDKHRKLHLFIHVRQSQIFCSLQIHIHYTSLLTCNRTIQFSLFNNVLFLDYSTSSHFQITGQVLTSFSFSSAVLLDSY
jgi:hypothetical protein